jgi:hypothetical protein
VEFEFLTAMTVKTYDVVYLRPPASPGFFNPEDRNDIFGFFPKYTTFEEL